MMDSIRREPRRSESHDERRVYETRHGHHRPIRSLALHSSVWRCVTFAVSAYFVCVWRLVRPIAIPRSRQSRKMNPTHRDDEKRNERQSQSDCAYDEGEE